MVVVKKWRHPLLVGALWLVVSQVAWGAPQIEQWQTKNGAQVLFVHAPELPMVDVRVVFDGGSARDGALPGLAQMVSGLLVDGAGSWSADQIAERMESVGARLGSGSARDMAWVTLRTLTEPKALDVAIDTMGEVIAKPTFESDDIERNRRAMQTALRLGEQKPGTVAKKAFYSALYGSHQYAIPSGGTRDSLTAINRDGLIDFHRRYYVGRNAIVAIVGALDRGLAESVAERVIGALPPGKPAPTLPRVQELETGSVSQIPFPSSQTHILMGQPGTWRGDPDYFALYVGNHILGGSGLVSQLSQEVREKRGLSYSVYSYFSPMRVAGPFIVGAQTKNSQAGDAVEVMQQTVQGYLESGPTEAELLAAKQNITGGFPLRIASNGKIVEYLATIGFYDLPLDYLDTFVAQVEAVTRERIHETFKRRLDPSRFVVITVGDTNEPAEGG